jgi:hypothetical protein
MNKVDTLPIRILLRPRTMAPSAQTTRPVGVLQALRPRWLAGKKSQQQESRKHPLSIWLSSRTCSQSLRLIVGSAGLDSVSEAGHRGIWPYAAVLDERG